MANRKLQDHYRGILLESSTAWAKLYVVAKAVGIAGDFNSINLVTGETQDEFFDALKTRFNIADLSNKGESNCAALAARRSGESLF